MIEQLLENKTHAEKAIIKADEIGKAFAKLEQTKAIDFDDSVYGHSIQIVGVQTETFVNGRVGLAIFARAFKGGEQVGFGEDGSVDIERFRFFNPPVLVEDEAGDIIREKMEDGVLKQRKLREDPIEAIEQSLAHTIYVVQKRDGKKVIKGKIGNTTSTFYSAAGANAPVDGYTNHAYSLGSGVNWATIHANSGNFADDATDDNSFCGITGDSVPGNYLNLKKGIYLFDTSTIGSDVVSAATLSFYGNSKSDNIGIGGTVFNMNVYASNPASTSSLTGTDWDTVGSTAFCDTPIIYDNWNTAGYNDYAFNATGIAAVATGGTTKLGSRNVSNDIANVDPGAISLASSALNGYFADKTGTANDPKLVVVHASSSAIKTHNGLAVASVKTVFGLAIASRKTWVGLA